MSRLDWSARTLIFLACVGLVVAPWPGGWFGTGELGRYHAASPEWHPHARYHMLWQAWAASFVGLSGALAVAFAWHRGHALRWLAAAGPFFMFSGNTVAYFWLAPALGIHDPVPHQHPTAVGLPQEVLGVIGVWAAALLGAVLDVVRWRRERQAQAASRDPAS